MEKLKLKVKDFCNRVLGNKLFKNELPEQNEIKKILIISLYFTGDLLFHTPVLEVLRKLIPGAEIDVWAKSRSYEILESNPLIRKIITFDNIKTASYREKTNFDVKGKRTFLRTLRKEKYDVILDLTGKYSTALFTLLAKPKYSAGLNYNYFGFCYDKFIPLYTATEPGHLISKYLSVVKRGLNVSDTQWNEVLTELPIKPYLYTSDQNKLKVDEFLRSKFAKADTPYIVLHLTSGWDAKELPKQTFAEVIKYLVDSNIRYLIIGDEKDKTRILEISELIKDEAVKPEKNFIILSLSQSAELIRRATLFIGSDSAPLHMAGAFNTPSIGLFGPTNPGFSNPVGINHRVIYRKLHCSASENDQYCTRNGGFSCPLYECMISITSAEIISLIEELYYQRSN